MSDRSRTRLGRATLSCVPTESLEEEETSQNGTRLKVEQSKGKTSVAEELNSDCEDVDTNVCTGQSIPPQVLNRKTPEESFGSGEASPGVHGPLPSKTGLLCHLSRHLLRKQAEVAVVQTGEGAR